MTLSARQMQERVSALIEDRLCRADDEYVRGEVEYRYPLPDRMTFQYKGHDYTITVEFEDPR